MFAEACYCYTLPHNAGGSWWQRWQSKCSTSYCALCVCVLHFPTPTHPCPILSQVNLIRRVALSGYPGFRAVWRECLVGLLLASMLVVVGFTRVYLLQGSVNDAMAITLSLFLIVCSSVTIGAALPLAFARAGMDAAHAGPTIQVIMDVLGVWMTCMVCSTFLTSPTVT